MGDKITFVNYPLETGSCPDVDELPYVLNSTILPPSQHYVAGAAMVRLAAAAV